MSARERGAFTVETCIGIVFLVSALVFMVPYLQRALQGNLFGVNQSVGLQYDPRNPHTETQGITMNETTKQQVVWAMFGADLIDPLPVNHYPTHLHDDRYWKRKARVLRSLPTGPIPREPAFQRSKVEASWTATQGSTYDDLR